MLLSVGWVQKTQKAAQSDCISGVIFTIAAKEKSDLGRAEGLGYGYEEKEVDIITDQREVQAAMYYATSIDDELVPYTWYVRFVIDGARQHRLPHDYIETIERSPQTADPDESKDAENRAVTC